MMEHVTCSWCWRFRFGHDNVQSDRIYIVQSTLKQQEAYGFIQKMNK